MRVCLNCTLKNGQEKKKSKQNKKTPSLGAGTMAQLLRAFTALCREAMFGSWHTQDSSTMSNSSSRESITFFYSLQASGMSMVHLHIHWQNIHVHK